MAVWQLEGERYFLRCSCGEILFNNWKNSRDFNLNDYKVPCLKCMKAYSLIGKNNRELIIREVKYLCVERCALCNEKCYENYDKVTFSNE